MDGWIILDKPSSVFSRSASSRVARLFGMKKSGHIGTLDPMASGVLPIAIGNATKMIPFIEELSDGNKEYLFSMRFGFDTDTLDITGTVCHEGGIVPSESEVGAVLKEFVGEYMQVPPQYSSVHVNGRRGYEMARCGENIEMPPRLVKIKELDFTGKIGESYCFRVACSRGTYVRSLCRDIAARLGTFGCADMIRRTKTNGFDIKNAVKLDFLEKQVNNSDALMKYLCATDFGLGGIPVLNLNDKDSVLYKNGGFIGSTLPDGRYRVYCGDVFIGIGDVINKQLRPVRTI